MEKTKTLNKIDEIIAELKVNGLWNKTEPGWVKQYEAGTSFMQNDFAEWLQFVYLPNCLQQKPAADPSIVPQAMRYYGEDLKKGRLLELLIELDALI